MNVTEPVIFIIVLDRLWGGYNRAMSMKAFSRSRFLCMCVESEGRGPGKARDSPYREGSVLFTFSYAESFSGFNSC